MSKFLVLSLLILMSCNEKTEVKDGGGIGQDRTFEPIVVRDLEDDFDALCSTLEEKANMLSFIVPTSYEYAFSYSQKNCSDAKASLPRIVRNNIVRDGNDYVYKMEDKEPFYLSSVETDKSGTMKRICDNLGRLETPILISRTAVMDFSLSKSNSTCRSTADTLCVFFDYGKLSGDKFTTHTEEFIRFHRTTGFIVERKLVSLAGCTDGQKIVKHAVLK